MTKAVTITRPDVVAMIERAADALTGGDTTELVAIAVHRLLDETVRMQSPFGADPGSVKVLRGVDLTQPIINPQTDAENGREVRR